MTILRLSPIAAAALLAACGAPDREAGPGRAAGPETRTMGYGLSRAAIDAATPQPAPETDPTASARADTPDAGLIRLQVLLDRARYSPGMIDGRHGSNLAAALRAFEQDQGLTADGVVDPEVFARLTTADSRPALREYVIQAADVAGPFIGQVPTGTEAQSRLPALGYADAREALAERFHVTQALLAALNPGVDFSRAGQTIIVPAVDDAPLPAAVDHVRVDKTEGSVSAYDAQGRRIAFYPATVGSSERPAPSGELTIEGVANEPDYTVDPERLTYGGNKKLVVAPGPNNPVGSVWIELSRDTYGIHGTPDPALIGKTASHGCIRLTNWDAEQLAAAVKPGVKVTLR